jgi:hypothetical protein
MPSDGRDEFGRIPDDVSRRLTPHPDKGQRPAVRANLSIASAGLVVVPNTETAERFPAILWVIQAIRSQRIPIFLCDPSTSMMDVASWLQRIVPTCGSRRVAVTGPRATRWPEGAALTRRVVISLASASGIELEIA